MGLAILRRIKISPNDFSGFYLRGNIKTLSDVFSLLSFDINELDRHGVLVCVDLSCVIKVFIKPTHPTCPVFYRFNLNSWATETPPCLT